MVGDDDMARPIHKLTVLTISRSRRDGRYGDGGGLYLQVDGGSKSCLFRYKRGGRTRYMGFGSVDVVGVDEARARALECRKLLHDGVDPIAAREVERAKRQLRIFQFILCRWYFRSFVWGRLLWQISRIKLNLMPTHPDRVGGLSFVSNTASVFSIFAVAHGALLAGYLSTRVLFLDASLMQFKSEIALMVVFVLCVTLGPLLVFGGQLVRVKREGLYKYGSLTTSYVKEFDDKWISRSLPPKSGY